MILAPEDSRLLPSYILENRTSLSKYNCSVHSARKVGHVSARVEHADITTVHLIGFSNMENSSESERLIFSKVELLNRVGVGSRRHLFGIIICTHYSLGQRCSCINIAR